MAHARRKFDESKDSNLVRASYVLTEIQKVYALERQAKLEARSWEQRYSLRQEKGIPILKNLKTWML